MLAYDLLSFDVREMVLRPQHLLCKPLLGAIAEPWLPGKNGEVCVYAQRCQSFGLLGSAFD